MRFGTPRKGRLPGGVRRGRIGGLEVRRRRGQTECSGSQLCWYGDRLDWPVRYHSRLQNEAQLKQRRELNPMHRRWRNAAAVPGVRRELTRIK
ncbi:hypothetical protein NDU88_000186 [Pleurodeles waltl]|uniref:Uncharacterized protein n=1 Tax=Pleurodeles waltl TaxID=8319 RepID=A0AAV7UP96_PLEWA|nr:hypothetical protein NDU88_000186 [Pleurodeles waltl]